MKTLIGILTVLAIVLTGGAYLLFRSKEKKTSDMTTVRENATKVYTRVAAPFRSTRDYLTQLVSRKPKAEASAA